VVIEIKARTWRRPIVLSFLSLLAGGGAALMSSGCGQGNNSSSNRETVSTSSEPTKIKICYLGLTCEPAIFVAYEKGFFKEEGLDVELVKTDWGSMRDGLADGRFHASYSFIMYMMKPIEMGLDLKLTAGIHTGCLRIQAGAKSNIKTVQDLKGKKLGITHMGSPPFLFASRVLADKGIDPKNGVEWVTMPGPAMSNALDQGRVDAVASAEPIGTMLMAQNKVHKVCDQASDAPYDDEYCCVVVVNGAFGHDHPSAAAKVTRALLKGAKWVNVNPTAAARIGVEKEYVAATMDINAQAIGMLRFEPGVDKARRDVRMGALEMKKAGFLKKDTDAEELAKKAWLDLDGVTDDWVKGLQVEKVAGGGRPAQLSPVDFAALFKGEPCCQNGACMGCCGDSSEMLLPMTGEWASVRPLRLDLALNPDARTPDH
jgi:NitT/TauT family transport system substrate-binding protein